MDQDETKEKVTEETKEKSKTPIVIAIALVALIAVAGIVFLTTNKSSDEVKQTSTTTQATDAPTTSASSVPSTNTQTMCSDHIKSAGSEAPFDSANQCSQFLDSLIGLSEEQATTKAEDNDLVLRVIQRDGEDLPATMNFVSNRVNISIADDKITKVTLG